MSTGGGSGGAPLVGGASREDRSSFRWIDRIVRWFMDTTPDGPVTGKVLQISFAAFQGATGGQDRSSVGYLSANSSHSLLYFVADVILPVGVSITNFRVKADEVASANYGPVSYLRYLDTSEAIQTIATIDHSGTTSPTWKTNAASLPKTVVSEESYYILVLMTWNAGEAVGPKLFKAEVVYDSPEIDKTL